MTCRFSRPNRRVGSAILVGSVNAAALERRDSLGIGSETTSSALTWLGESLRIVSAHDIDGCRATIPLQTGTWGPGSVVLPTVMLTAVQEGGYVGLAYAEDGDPVGFVFGFVGVHDGNVRHRSQRLAVDPRYRGSGVATALKLAQREQCLKQGIKTMVWTADPLRPRNGRFNLNKLGATCNEYLVDFYGQMNDELNAGLPSDRFLVGWSLTSTRVSDCLREKRAVPSLERIEATGAPNLIDLDGVLRGSTALRGHDRALVEVPRDIDAVKAHSLEHARAWREHTRAAFRMAFSAGYTAVDLVRTGDGLRCAYVLERLAV